MWSLASVDATRVSQSTNDAFLVRFVNYIFEGHAKLKQAVFASRSASSSGPFTDGAEDSDPDGPLRWISAFSPVRCPQGFSMCLSDYCPECDYSAFTCNYCRSSGEGRRWYCAHCETDVCFSCMKGPEEYLSSRLSAVMSVCSSKTLLRHALDPHYTSSPQLDRFLLRIFYTDECWNAFQYSLQQMSLDHNTASSKCCDKAVKSLCRAAARVYCTTVCTESDLAHPLEEATAYKSKSTDTNRSSDGQPMGGPIGRDASMNGAVSARIRVRASWIFELFPLQAVASLSEHAQKWVTRVTKSI